MKTRRLTFAIVTCFALCGCAPKVSITVPGPKGASAEAEMTVYELVVRNLVAEEPDGKVILVSFGKSWIDHVDPPKKFFERLADVDVSLKPVSERSQLSDQNAQLFEVRLIEWTSEFAASVSVTRFRFGVGAADGFTATAQWTDGVWKLAKTTGHWNI